MKKKLLKYMNKTGNSAADEFHSFDSLDSVGCISCFYMFQILWI